MFRLATALLLLLAAAAALLTIEGHSALGAQWIPIVAADAEYTCNITVSPGGGTPLQSAISSAPQNATICVRAGVYNEAIRMTSSRTGIKLVNYPGETPIIDGLKRKPGTKYGSLVKIEASGVVFEGFEVRNSSSRGVVVGVKDVAISNIVLRNLKIHDNWDMGLLIEGTEVNGSIRWVSNVVVENNNVYRNVRKAERDPVIYKATKSGSNWTFNPDANWDAPYWSGAALDWSESLINGLHVTPNGDGTPSRLYVTAVARNRPSWVNTGWSATGSAFTYEGRDILMYNTATRKWTTFFDGSDRSLGTAKTNIDALYIEPTSGGCGGCNPIWMSFSAATAVPGVGTAQPGDIVKFTPTASPNAYGQLGNGTFSMYRTAANLAIGSANLDALDRHPDGRLVIGTAATSFAGGDKADLFIQNGTGWTKYFDGGDTPLNPFYADAASVWLDGAGNVHIGGNSIGGSAVVFIEAKDSIARRNNVYENFGEGLVAGRKSERITLEENKVWDHPHNGIGLNTTQFPIVQRNLVFCTNNRTFWGKQGYSTAYRPGPGIDLTDENFVSTRAAPSQGQVIINNIVVGCSINFSVASQISGGGLNGALIANNSFIEARGETGAKINNVNFDSTASYNNSKFINNLIVQSTANGSMIANRQGTLPTSGFVISDNLYSRAPGLKDWWLATEEPGRIVGDPMLVNPILPTSATVDPGWYALRSASSPAVNAGAPAAQVVNDFFRLTRSGGLDVGADEYNATAAANGTVIVQVETPGATGPLDFSFSGDFGGFSLGSSTAISTTMSERAPGTYALQQEPLAGWVLDSVSCLSDDFFDATTVQDGTVLLDVDEDEKITCTFTNKLDSGSRTGSITVIKQTEPDGDPTPFTFAASWDEAGFNLADGQTTGLLVLPIGPYTVSETQPAGWLEMSAVCTGDDDGNSPMTIMLDKDEAITCTFFSQYAPEVGTIAFEKRTNPPGDTTLFDFTASWSPSTITLADGDSVGPVLLNPGPYSIVENVPGGWDLASAICTGDDDGTDPASITLEAGEAVVCTFTNTRDVAPTTGSITVAKVTDPAGDETVFEFDPSWSETAISLSDGQSSAPAELAPGIYSVSETLPADWTQTGAICTGDDDGTDPASINLEAGEAVVCTFTNTRDVAPTTGTITIAKMTDPADDPTDFDFEASWSEAAISLAGGQSSEPFELAPGAYAVTETVPAGWTQTDASCTGDMDPAAITLSAGQDIVCTFTNTKDPEPANGAITVLKVTDPAGDPTVFQFDPSWSETAISLSDGQSSGAIQLSPGSYSVSEMVPAGWTQTEASCTGDDDGANPAAIVLDAGESVVCTFTNALNRGRIITALATDPASGGPVSFDPSWSEANFSLSDGDNNDSGVLLPGTYSLTQVAAPAGWSQTGAECSGGAAASTPSAIVVGPGETVSCTLTYTLGRGSIVIRKQVNDASDQTPLSFTGSWGATIVLSDTLEANSGPLAQGSYAITVGALPGGWSQTDATCTSGTPAAVTVVAGQTTTCTFSFTKPLAPADMFTISAASTGTVAGVGSYGVSDLLTYRRGGPYGRLYTQSALGLTKNVRAMERMADGSYLLVLARNQTLPGAGTVTPWDVVRYVPAAGSTPARYELYLDGSANTLATSSEQIDALAIAPDGRLLLSITGAGLVNPTASAFKPQNEDLFAWNKATRLFEPYFVGKPIAGVAVENLVNASVAANGDIYASFADTFKIGALTGNARSVIQFRKTGAGVSAYTVVSPAFLHWTSAGFPSIVDAFDIDLAP